MFLFFVVPHSPLSLLLGWVDFNAVDGSRLTVQSPTVLFTFTSASWLLASTTYTTARYATLSSGALLQLAPASLEPSTFALNVLPNRVQRRSLSTSRYFIQFAASSSLQVGYYNNDLTVPGKELTPIFLAPSNPLGKLQIKSWHEHSFDRIDTRVNCRS